MRAIKDDLLKLLIWVETNKKAIHMMDIYYIKFVVKGRGRYSYYNFYVN